MADPTQFDPYALIGFGAQEQNPQPAQPAPFDPQEFADTLPESFKKEQNNVETAINEEKVRRDAAAEARKEHETTLGRDPYAEARAKYLDMYKWKGASKMRKLGSVGLGILDAATRIGSGGKDSIEGRIENKELAKDKIRRETAEKELMNQRIIENNAAGNYRSLVEKQAGLMSQKEIYDAKEKTARDLAAMKDSQHKDNLQVKLRNAKSLEEIRAVQGEAAQALAGLRASQMNIPKSGWEASVLEKLGRIPEGSGAEGARLTKESKWPPGSGVGAGLTVQNESEKGKLYRDPITGEFKIDMYKPASIINKANATSKEVVPQGGPRLGGAELSSQEIEKTIKPLMNTQTSLTEATATMLDDIRSGAMSKYSGLYENPLIRSLYRLIENDTTLGPALAQGPQAASLATLQHIKGLYGGRAPLEMSRDIASIVEGRGQNDVNKLSAIMSQKYLLELFLMDKSGDAAAGKMISDPNFYRYTKMKMTALIEAAKSGVSMRVPTMDSIIREFNQRQGKKDSGTTGANINPANPATQKNPIAMKTFEENLRNAAGTKKP